MRNKLFVLLLGVVAFYGSALAADEFKIDPVHSTVAFSVKHMVVNTVHGRFNDYSGTILLDDKDPSKSSVEVSIKTASINTDNAQRDGHLKSPDFLDAAKYPEITFKSNSVEKKGDGYMAHGTLAIRGVSKNVDMPFKLNGPINVGGSSLLGAEASLTINRQDYGVSWSKTLDGGSLVVSNDVKIDINVEAKQAKPAAAAGASK
ncbi:MAG TPA: YceI family protein [Candidatus Limnocylindrales bacterium]|nr:YceI family protein [Candidatus Limnocylindrales bacterium]